MNLNTEQIIEELSEKLDHSESLVKKLEDSNQFLESENLELISQLKEKEIKHDTEFKALLQNMDELLENNQNEKEGLNFDIEILKKKLKSQKNFVEMLKQEKTQLRNMLEEKITESNKEKPSSEIQNMLTKENKQLKTEIKTLEKALKAQKASRGSLTSQRSTKQIKTIHPKKKPLKRHSVLESMVHLKETQVMALRNKLEDLINKHHKTRIQLKRQTSIEIREIKKREVEIQSYKDSLGSLETNLETLTEMNFNLNRDLEEKERVLEQNELGKCVLRVFKVIFDVLEGFLNGDFLIGLFFVFMAVTAWDSLCK